MIIEQNFTKKDLREMEWIILGQKARTSTYKTKTALLAVCGVVLLVLTALLYKLENQMTAFCWFILIFGIITMGCAAVIVLLLESMRKKFRPLANQGTFTAEITDDGTLLYHDHRAKLADMRGALCRPYLFLFENYRTMYVFKLTKENEMDTLRALSQKMTAPIDLCDYGFVIGDYIKKDKTQTPGA